MTNEQLIQKFNPQNLGNLSADDIETMRSLTNEQIDVLAKEYPNQPHRKAYLRLYDKNVPAGKQLYNLTTWQNLRNLRKFQSKNNLIAWEPFNVKIGATAPVKSSTPVVGAASPLKKVVDLSAKEAAAELQKVQKNANAAKAKTETPEAEKEPKIIEAIQNPEKSDPENKTATEKKTAGRANSKNKVSDDTNTGENQAGGTIPADQDFSNGDDQ